MELKLDAAIVLISHRIPPSGDNMKLSFCIDLSSMYVHMQTHNSKEKGKKKLLYTCIGYNTTKAKRAVPPSGSPYYLFRVPRLYVHYIVTGLANQPFGRII